PEADLVELLAPFPVVVTVEAHSVVGGLGSLVSEVVAEHGLGCRVLRCGVRAAPDGIGGSEAFLNARHGLSADGIAAAVQRAVA
ncbi:MAG: transketolase family protein, partial [Acidimicrobiales bacterium]